MAHDRMLEIMEPSDLVITAAGNTFYELAALGVPAIIICHHERHLKVAEKFSERQAAMNLGIGSGLPEGVLAKTVRDLLDDRQHRADLSASIKRVVDGQGCRRITEVMAHLYS